MHIYLVTYIWDTESGIHCFKTMEEAENLVKEMFDGGGENPEDFIIEETPTSRKYKEHPHSFKYILLSVVEKPDSDREWIKFLNFIL